MKIKKEKKKTKSGSKKTIILFFILLIIISIIAVVNFKNYQKISIKGKTYYLRLNKKVWNGKHQQENLNIKKETNFSIMEVVSYSKYLKTIDMVNSTVKNKIKPNYTNKKSNYLIIANANNYTKNNLELIDYVEKSNKIILYGKEELAILPDDNGYFIAIPTNMPVGTKIDYRECNTALEIYNLSHKSEITVSDKPIIYLYPTKETEISVSLLKEENITYSYPKYKDKWHVLAHPDGNLQDLSTGRNLYSLYYECNNTKDFKVEKDGFVIKGKDTIEFLEEKLAVLGLSEKETEEFIIYWLPKLESNKYNYIRFATQDEINENMTLEINPNPDTIIRVLMTFKKLDSPINVQEQQLKTPIRTGYTAVEWGGTEIK